MKNLVILFALMTISIFSFAQNEKFIKIMEANIAKLGDVKSPDDMQALANTFERIAGAEKEEWLPSYYASFCYMNLATMYMESNPAKMVASVEKAQNFIDIAKAIAPNESEVHTMQGYIYQGRIWENPMVKGAEYTQLCYVALGTAMQMDPNNPRPHYIKGQNLLYTPTFFGGGPEAATPSLTTAKEKYKAFKPASSIHPTWGAGYNQRLLDKIASENPALVKE